MCSAWINIKGITIYMALHPRCRLLLGDVDRDHAIWYLMYANGVANLVKLKTHAMGRNATAQNRAGWSHMQPSGQQRNFT